MIASGVKAFSIRWKNLTPLNDMYREIILDTGFVADLIAIYYEEELSKGKSNGFIPKYSISRTLAKEVNKIYWDSLYNDNFSHGVVVASTFAFIEISRKYQEIVQNRFSIVKFRAFISSPPPWFVIEPLQLSLLDDLRRVPSTIHISSFSSSTIEFADAIHVATTLTRGANSALATKDSKLVSMDILKSRILV